MSCTVEISNFGLRSVFLTQECRLVNQTEVVSGSAKLGILARLVRVLRARIRKLFRRKDPNIYPFF